MPSLDETTIINLDPYLDADPNFDPNDVVGGLMAQLQKDNHTWAYPLTIQAQTLSYNAHNLPAGGRARAGKRLDDLDQFIDALHTLKDYLEQRAVRARTTSTANR